jgi:hypothetical protein
LAKNWPPDVPEGDILEFTKKLEMVFWEGNEKRVAILGRIVFHAYGRGNHSAGQARPIIA